MISQRSRSTTFALGIALVVFLSSLWYLNQQSSVTEPLFKESAAVPSNTLGGKENNDSERKVKPGKQSIPSHSTSWFSGGLFGSSKTPYCKWVFESYESSSYEAEWFMEVPNIQSTTAEDPNICNIMKTPKHATAALDILQRVMELKAIDSTIQWSTYDSMPTTSTLHPADMYMSRMHYRRVCYDDKTDTFHPAPGHGVQLIEPLFGMLRDPYDIYCGGDRLVMEDDHFKNQRGGQSKLHIMPQGYSPYAYTTKDNDDLNESALWRTHGIPPWHSSLRPVGNEHVGTSYSPPQNIHLDLGSAYFAGWTVLGGAKNLAASGQWIYDTYHARGQKFDRFIAVEVQTLNDTIAYEQVPKDLVGIYTLMNIPLTMTDDKLNTIEMIKRIVKPEDFFIFKLDIDSAPIEEPIVQSLLADSPEEGGASGLIDELMFEHHVNYWPMNRIWQTSRENSDLLSSYNLFRDLRRKGIRAHSWP